MYKLNKTSWGHVSYPEQKMPEVIMRQDGRLVCGVCKGAACPSWKHRTHTSFYMEQNGRHWLFKWVKSYLWGLSGVAQLSVAQWACQVFEPWADRQGSLQTTRQWDCSFYPFAASQFGCEAPCSKSDRQYHNFLPTVSILRGGNYLRFIMLLFENCESHFGFIIH